MPRMLAHSKRYSNRQQRCQFVAASFDKYLGNSVANIGGGGSKHLRAYLDPSVTYFEVDNNGNPDLIANLETDLPLPLEDNSWETVVCTDVLEHVDNLHNVFDELVRISSQYIIISLPNPFESTFKSYALNHPERRKTDIEREVYGRYSKFYGIPYKCPIDRHKWFFSYTDAEDFFYYKASEHRLQIKELLGLGYYGENLTKKFIRLLVALLLGDDTRKNLFNRSIWVVFEKQTPVT
jgi:hypothetical protein